MEQVLLDDGAWHFGFHEQQGLAERVTSGRELDYLRTFIRAQAYDDRAFRRAFPPAALRAYARQYRRPGRMSAGFGWYRAFDADERDFRRLAGTPLSMPVLGLGGERSAGPLMAAWLAPVAAAPEVATIPRSGYWLPEERPGLVVERLLPFLRADD